MQAKNKMFLPEIRVFWVRVVRESASICCAFQSTSEIHSSVLKKCRSCLRVFANAEKHGGGAGSVRGAERERKLCAALTLIRTFQSFLVALSSILYFLQFRLRDPKNCVAVLQILRLPMLTNSTTYTNTQTKNRRLVFRSFFSLLHISFQVYPVSSVWMQSTNLAKTFLPLNSFQVVKVHPKYPSNFKLKFQSII